jgi:hypothetical protein
LTTIQFPSSLEILGDFSFAFCSSLDHVFFVPGEDETWRMTEIGTGAFFDCPFARQGSLRIPETVETVGDFAFQSRNLGDAPLNLVLPPTSKLQRLSTKSFANRRLRYLELPPSIQEISDFCFANCHELQDISLNIGLRRLERGCFQRSSFVAITIPHTVAMIGESCFSECDRLTSVTFEAPSELRTIGALAFQRAAIELITIPATVSEIGQGAFLDCRDLRGLTFAPASQIASIGSKAFSGTVQLVNKIILPPKVSFLGESCF